MTTPDQIVRQRLAAALTEIRALFRPAQQTNDLSSTGKQMMAIIDRALASPSEGNKKEDEAAEGWWVTPVWKHDGPRLLVLTVGGLRMGSVYDEETLGWSVARDHVEWDGEPYFPTREEAQAALIAAVRGPLASRPQEQPRKAMGEITPERYAALSAEVDRQDREIADLERRIGALSVSPAAAQGWQSVPVAWRVSLPSGAVFLQIEKPTTILDRHNKPIEGAVIDPLYSAAPSSPAAQEQEKGGQT